jgi:hypothetical protein
MASNRFRVIAVSLALALSSVSAAPVLAADPPAVSQASLEAAMTTDAASQTGFASLSADAKANALQAAILTALTSSGALGNPQLVAKALLGLVAKGTIPAGLARKVAASSPALAAAFNAEVALATGSIGGNDAPTLLVPVNNTPGGAPPVIAPYDPCAGVIASYC